MNVCVQNDEMESLQIVNVIQFLPSKVSHTALPQDWAPVVCRSPPLVFPWAFLFSFPEPWHGPWGPWRPPC